MSFAHRLPPDSFTYMGKKVTYDVSTDEYIVEDGKRIPSERIREAMQGLSSEWLGKLDNDLQRQAIEEANRITLLNWEKKLNAQILKYVRLALEHGAVNINVIPIEETITFDVNGNHDRKVQFKSVQIAYDYSLPPTAAYIKLREEVEKLVRGSMKPPPLKRLG